MLVVTIGAGCLFGMLGLVLAAPLVSAGTKIFDQLSRPLDPSPGAKPDAGRHAHPNGMMLRPATARIVQRYGGT